LGRYMACSWFGAVGFSKSGHLAWRAVGKGEKPEQNGATYGSKKKPACKKGETGKWEKCEKKSLWSVRCLAEE